MKSTMRPKRDLQAMPQMEDPLYFKRAPQVVLVPGARCLQDGVLFDYKCMFATGC